MAFDIPAVPGFAFGGDYSAEQWPEPVWVEDVGLMKTAGVNLATVGVFSWALLETAPGRYEFDWLDRLLDLLAGHGVAVDLATATASPPPWFSHAHPESLPVGPTGTTIWYGSRQAYCPSSPAYRTAAARLVEQLATRYAGHPALAMWHVNNEYGCHISRCWCDISAAAFRDWLRNRYGDLAGLNAAWGTSFWSQRYTDWEQIIPPRDTPSYPNPTQQLDFHRFSSDELLACFRVERDLLHRLSPGVPVTTNFLGGLWDLDYWAWAREVDVVSMDHYLIAEHPQPYADLAFVADLARSLAGGRPWALMEHATSAVNWQPRNLAKPPGRLRRDSLAHVARGADSVLYFQWRASKAGAEKWHSGMVPHAGTDSKVWQEVVALGAELGALAEVVGSEVVADVAILLDWSSLWAQRQPSQPSVDLDPLAVIKGWHAALTEATITCDLAHPESDLRRYRLVLAPALYLVSDAGAANLTGFVAGGGTALVGPYSGVVDDNDHVRLGGYPGAWRDLLGVRVQEHFPLPAGARVALTDGGAGSVWTELAVPTDAEVLTGYADGPLAGSPALTRRAHGAGTAYYLTTLLAGAHLRDLLTRLARDAGVTPVLPDPPEGVTAVQRRHPDGRGYTFIATDGPTAPTLTVRRDGDPAAGTAPVGAAPPVASA
ncbi:beta-galactosidase [Solwaraspora sp. WMMD1047]|uniref:beta-galactosidase n=1 Tax=Solwaraspora sp. WMMD1047 TaxID=3016102 RepID=UPI00241707E2|nr:beta-galactosidase [Solwaraspora sp. WMMD1047]MDG4831324.1 beta-galactosidase [Solwaraspora sp. WMMD1047]